MGCELLPESPHSRACLHPQGPLQQGNVVERHRRLKKVHSMLATKAVFVYRSSVDRGVLRW
jgi:hypothetical protein